MDVDSCVQNQENFIIAEMTKLYLLYTSPVITVKRRSEASVIIDTGIRWTNKQAKELYENYERVLNKMYKQ